MEYTVNKLAEISGVTKRTLRYYDEIGLLNPSRINSSGYRIYGRKEVERLQQILFFRALDVSLEEIKELMTSEDYDEKNILIHHREKLMERRQQLDRLIQNVEKTIAEAEGRLVMTDKEKFEGLKNKMLKENEEKYGKEIREKYGKEVVEKSNEKYANMSEEVFNKANTLAAEIIELLLKAMDEGNPAGETALQMASKHKEWLMIYWPTYSKEAHEGLGDMYVADERFTAYYDQHRTGAAKFLRDAIYAFNGDAL